MLDAYKELVPILYGENGIKYYKYYFHANDICFQAHWHDRIEFLQILSGSVKIHLNNEEFIAVPGQTVIIMPTVIHSGFSEDNGVVYNVLSFDIEKFSNTTLASENYLLPIIKQSVKLYPIANHPTFTQTMNELVTLLSTDGTINPLLIIGKTYELLGLFYQLRLVTKNHVYKLGKPFSDILEYLNKHYTENISTKSISQKFGYNEAYFCRNFKRITGMTTMKYIGILRLELAQKLLSDGNESIENISWQCGFSNSHYFINCFKQHFGITPKAFRNLTHHVEGRFDL